VWNGPQLEAFYQVAVAGGYYQAAAVLCITQSAVTHRVKALEAELGVKLFVPEGRRVVLSRAGERLLVHCRQIRVIEGECLAGMREEASGCRGRFKVVCGSEAARSRVLAVLATLGRQAPGLDIELLIDDWGDPRRWLRAGEAELVILDHPYHAPHVVVEPLFSLEHVLVVGASGCTDWPDEPARSELFGLRAVDFHAPDRTTLEFLQLCYPDEDLSDLRRHFVNDAHGICDWVCAGGAFAVLPLELVRPALMQGRLRRLFPGISRFRTLYAHTMSAPHPAWPELARLLRADGGMSEDGDG
jgi:LysR family transcriptional regulator (chromosome initiation inhibitor)